MWYRRRTNAITTSKMVLKHRKRKADVLEWPQIPKEQFSSVVSEKSLKHFCSEIHGKLLTTTYVSKVFTACYGHCRPKKLTPWEILCFQPLWDMGGPYCSSGNFFYLAVFEISELVANIGWKLKHLVPRDSFFIVMDLKNGAYSKTAK